MTCESCPVCGVKIKEDSVMFSYGKPGSRERLYARVCRYAKDRDNCINQEHSNFTEEDCYAEFSQFLSLHSD